MEKLNLQNYIRRNELDAFFQAASQIHPPDPGWHNELVLLERRHIELKTNEHGGILSNEEASRQRNAISRDCMKLLEALDAPPPVHPAYPAVRKPSKLTLWLSLGAGVLATFLVWQYGLSPKENPPIQKEPSVATQDSSTATPDANQVVEKPKPVVKPSDNQPATTPKRTTTTSEQTKKQGIALKVSGNNAAFESEVESFIQEILLEKGIKTRAAAPGGSYASSIKCQFAINKTRTTSGIRDDAFNLVVKLELTARNADNVICFSKSFTSAKVILYEGEDEIEMARQGLKNLFNAVKTSGIKACMN